MDIHKPKPWHGFREFLKEYLIIVVGVLTALGAEQAVEWLHTAHSARAADSRVREEASRLMALADERIAAAPCVAGELAKVRGVLSSGAPLPNLPRLRTPPFRPGTMAEWDSALRSGLHEHFPEPEQRFLPLIAGTARVLGDTEVRERELWQRLATIEGNPRSLDPVTRESLLQIAVLADELNNDVRVVSAQLIKNGESAGLSPLQRDPDGTPVTHAAEIRAHGCQTWP